MTVCDAPVAPASGGVKSIMLLSATASTELDGMSALIPCIPAHVPPEFDPGVRHESFATWAPLHLLVFNLGIECTSEAAEDR